MSNLNGIWNGIAFGIHCVSEIGGIGGNGDRGLGDNKEQMTIDLVVGVVCMQRLDGGLIFTCGDFQSIKSKKISNDCFVRRLIYSYSDHTCINPRKPT